jgi:hypothetical protein
MTTTHGKNGTVLTGHTSAQRGWTQVELAALCRAAEAAWARASDRARRVVFTWRTKRYQSTLTSFRMLIKTTDGEPVAQRYH